MNNKQWMMGILAAIALGTVARAQVGTAAVESGKAVSETAKQAGDEIKSGAESQPDRTLDKAKAHAHKASAKHHGHRAKQAMKPSN